jgi:hypothetical protein
MRAKPQAIKQQLRARVHHSREEALRGVNYFCRSADLIAAAQRPHYGF